jgi:hypothetical protein
MTRTGGDGILQHADDLHWHLDAPETIDPRRPGILEFRIEGVGSYIVRATSLRRCIRQYEESVWRRGNGLPHRVGAYRGIHQALRNAADEGGRVTVILLENCDAAEFSPRKQHYAALRGTLDGAG